MILPYKAPFPPRASFDNRNVVCNNQNGCSRIKTKKQLKFLKKGRYACHDYGRLRVESCCLWLLLTWLTLDDGVTESSSSVVVRGSVRLDESKAPRSPSKSKKFNFFETKIQYELKVSFNKSTGTGVQRGHWCYRLSV